MASNRHLGRIIALQTLYEQEFRQDCQDKSFQLSSVLERNIGRYKTMVEDQEFIVKLVKGVDEKMSEIDAILQPIAPEWPINQIARMDRMVLRIGTYELLFGTHIPPKVVINESVELAKAFGGENSSKFINGVLGTVLRNKDADKTVTDTPPKEEKEKAQS
ncbi:MAG: transcription antitermination factor NusB [Candidatus Saccharimonadales bacterium]